MSWGEGWALVWNCPHSQTDTVIHRICKSRQTAGKTGTDGQWTSPQQKQEDFGVFMIKKTIMHKVKRHKMRQDETLPITRTLSHWEILTKGHFHTRKPLHWGIYTRRLSDRDSFTLRNHNTGTCSHWVTFTRRHQDTITLRHHHTWEMLGSVIVKLQS